MKLGKMNLLLFFFLAAALWMPLSGCDDDDDDTDDDVSDDDAVDDDAADDDAAPAQGYARLALVLPADAGPIVTLAAGDAEELLGQVFDGRVALLHEPDLREDTLNIVIGDEGIAQQVFSAAECEQMAAESFRIRVATVNDRRMIVIYGADGRGTQYGVFDLLESFGFGFFHPEETYVPPLEIIEIPPGANTYQTPSYGRRGFHIHTMHPLPHTEFLMRDDPQHLIWAKRLVDWLAHNKQNYMQWELLRTVDFDATVNHFRAIVDYAHRRGVNVGIVVSWVFMQQKAWRIVPDLKRECREEMEANIDQLMQAPWDHLHFEMGSSEFTEVDDRIQVKWMDNVVAYLAQQYPNTDASVKVHCSSGQTAEHYGDINFNYLPQEADPGMGIYPHTVQFYDLQGPAPAYGNEDFSELVDWMMTQIGQRKVYYYPETAYWCSWDIDVPLFLPVYLFNRWKDIVFLADKGLDGHVTFTSGHEWGYWLNDWVVARSTWDARLDWQDILNDFTAVFGEAGNALFTALRDLTLHQEDLLIGFNLAPYIAGQDTWDELGYFVGTTTHPKPITFSELYQMNARGIYDLQDSALQGLADMLETYTYLLEKVEAVRGLIPAPAATWYEELTDSFLVNWYRTKHAYLLYAGATARRLAELGENPDGEELAQLHFAEAQEITFRFLMLMRKREMFYRYPVELSSGWGRSLTSYDFKYLYQASTGYWYTRYEKQAIDKNFDPFLDNLIDPIWFFL